MGVQTRRWGAITLKIMHPLRPALDTGQAWENGLGRRVCQSVSAVPAAPHTCPSHGIVYIIIYNTLLVLFVWIRYGTASERSVHSISL